MLDTISLEKKGLPAAVIGLDKLVNTTGKAMARTQGYATLGFAVFPYSPVDWGGSATDEEVEKWVAALVPQIEGILIEKDE